MPNFTRAHRILAKPQFDKVFQEGRKHGDSFFLVVVKANKLADPRLGLAVSARSVGNAVNRNRIKRIIRDSFRLCRDQLPVSDIVISTRHAARDATNQELRKSLEQHWARLLKQ